MTQRDVPSVFRAASLRLKVDTGGTWTYAANHREVIDAHWKMALKANPGFFNGTIHLLTALHVRGDHIDAMLVPTQFKDFLYWRDEGFPAEARVQDGFGSALIRSREGHVILGRQRPGNINGGMAYLPGGFIDTRDVAANGLIDISASIAREVAEETGLGAAELTATPGFVVAQVFPHVSFAVIYKSSLTAAELVDRICAHIAADSDPELAEPVVLRTPEDMQGQSVTHYARVLLSSPLAWT